MITGVILARNEEHNIINCVTALRPHVSEIILIDMESEDCTVKLAVPQVDRVLTHELVPNFDAARNIAIPKARFDWLWFVDADERISVRTGRLVNKLVRERGHLFEAISIPFKSYFCGQWMQHCGWWPGYTMPRVLKRGHFHFAERVHGGVEMHGHQIRLPPDPELGIEHFSYQSIKHYIKKFNRYTTIEAEQLAANGARWNWREATRQMVRDLWWYYEHNPGYLDGERGWVLAWLSGQYRWLSQAKLLDLASPAKSALDAPSVPTSLDDLLTIMHSELMTLRTAKPTLPLGIVWRSPIWDPSGYADEGRTFIKALANGARELALEEIHWSDKTCTLPSSEAALLAALTRVKRPQFTATITNCIPTLCQPDPYASLNILRTTFETDRIPINWRPHLDKFDEIWVISRHNAAAFRRSWVPPEKIRIVPSCLDTELYSPLGTKLKLPGSLSERFVYLSVLDWQYRKGWDVLLRAYAQEFNADDGVGLLLKVSSSYGYPMDIIRLQAEQILSELNQSLVHRPDIVLWDETLNGGQMPALYRSVDAFALASRGEGWGRPYMEAMACGLPVIGTIGSGNNDFMSDENSLLIPTTLVDVPEHAICEIPIYHGHRWYEPNIAELRRGLRLIFSDRKHSQRIARRAARDVRKNFGLDAGRLAIEAALSAAENRFRKEELPPLSHAQLRVKLEGEFYAAHSFSNINEQLAMQFLARPEVALSLSRVEHNPTYDQQSYYLHRLRPFFDRRFDQGPEVIIRHAFPPNWERPNIGRWVHVQPWEYGHLPVDWIRPLRDEVDEVWVPSQYVRQVYERSGIPSHKIQVIPWGIDPKVFNPQAPPLILPTNKSFAFLFVGGVIARKGADIAIQAYLEEFGPDEDVCLVVKDIGRQTFYRDSPCRDQLLQAIQDSNRPAIVYVDQLLTDGQMASMYTSCNCLVAPYRGEGFGLPILEAMACGLAPIVPSGGPSDDFVTEQTGFIVPSRVVECQHSWPLCGAPTEFQVNIADVRRAMRLAFNDRTTLSQKGRLAGEHVRQHFTWAQSVEKMTQRLCTLVDKNDSTEVLSTNTEALSTALVQPPTLCVLVTTNNNEMTLGNCLAHIAPFVDQLIVVDDGSEDHSVAIAREYGAEIYCRGSLEDSVDARNAALTMVTSDWLLLLDATETLAETSIKHIKRCMVKSPPEVLALSLQIAKGITYANGKQRPPELRVFRRISDLAFEIHCNGEVLPAVLRNQFQVLQMPIVLNRQIISEPITTA